MKQSDFDALLCKGWQQNMKTGYLMTMFVERNGYPKPEAYQGAYDILVAAGIERVPTYHYWFGGVGAWLTQSYPQFLDAVLRSNDASKIVLDWLKFAPLKKPIKSQSTSAQNHTQKVYQAARLGNMIQLSQDHGDPLHGHRTKSPVHKRKNA